MTELTIDQRKALRAAAHHLNPVVSLGQQGLTEAVLKEIDRALKAHELIKVKLHGIERDDRDQILTEICAALTCQPVQHIGKMFVLWRENPEELAPPVQRKTSAPRAAKPRTKKQAAAATEKTRRRAVR